MHKLIRGFNKPEFFRQLRMLENKVTTRFVQQYNIDNENEEIVETVLGKFITIGINIPDTKNLLTETALVKLHNSIKKFEQDEKLSSAVLYGFGGNFCTGIVPTSDAEELGQDLLKVLHTLKKPTIVALNGYTKGFGLLLAIMCDLRAIEEHSIIGLYKDLKSEIPLFLYERLILTVGLTKASELILTRNMWTASEFWSAGLANRVVGPGCCQGQSILWAQSIAFANPLEKIMEQKSKILSFLSKSEFKKVSLLHFYIIFSILPLLSFQ